MKVSWWEVLVHAVKALRYAGWCDVCYRFSGYLHHMYNEERWCSDCLSWCQD